MQAISAAYLTRVVGRSMADWLALMPACVNWIWSSSNGRRRLWWRMLRSRSDWTGEGFMKQSQQWLLQLHNNFMNCFRS